MKYLIIIPILTTIMMSAQSNSGHDIRLMISALIAFFIIGVLIVLESIIRCYILNRKDDRYHFSEEFDTRVGFILISVSSIFIAFICLTISINNLIG